MSFSGTTMESAFSSVGPQILAQAQSIEKLLEDLASQKTKTGNLEMENSKLFQKVLVQAESLEDLMEELQDLKSARALIVTLHGHLLELQTDVMYYKETEESLRSAAETMEAKIIELEQIIFNDVNIIENLKLKEIETGSTVVRLNEELISCKKLLDLNQDKVSSLENKIKELEIAIVEKDVSSSSQISLLRTVQEEFHSRQSLFEDAEIRLSKYNTMFSQTSNSSNLYVQELKNLILTLENEYARVKDTYRLEKEVREEKISQLEKQLVSKDSELLLQNQRHDIIQQDYLQRERLFREVECKVALYDSTALAAADSAKLSSVKFENLENQIKILENKIVTLEADKVNLNSKVNSLNATVEEKSDTISKFSKKNYESEEELKRMQLNLDHALQSIKELESLCSISNERVSSLISENTDFADRIDDYSKNMQTLLEKSSREITFKDSEIETLRKNLELVISKCESISKNSEDRLKVELNKLDTEHCTEIQNLENKNIQLQKNLQELELLRTNEKVSWNESINKMEAELIFYRNSLEKKSSEEGSKLSADSKLAMIIQDRDQLADICHAQNVTIEALRTNFSATLAEVSSQVGVQINQHKTEVLPNDQANLTEFSISEVESSFGDDQEIQILLKNLFGTLREVFESKNDTVHSVLIDRLETICGKLIYTRQLLQKQVDETTESYTKLHNHYVETIDVVESINSTKRSEQHVVTHSSEPSIQNERDFQRFVIVRQKLQNDCSLLEMQLEKCDQVIGTLVEQNSSYQARIDSYELKIQSLSHLPNKVIALEKELAQSNANSSFSLEQNTTLVRDLSSKLAFTSNKLQASLTCVKYLHRTISSLKREYQNIRTTVSDQLKSFFQVEIQELMRGHMIDLSTLAKNQHTRIYDLAAIVSGNRNDSKSFVDIQSAYDKILQVNKEQSGKISSLESLYDRVLQENNQNLLKIPQLETSLVSKDVEITNLLEKLSMYERPSSESNRYLNSNLSDSSLHTAGITLKETCFHLKQPSFNCNLCNGIGLKRSLDFRNFTTGSKYNEMDAHIPSLYTPSFSGNISNESKKDNILRELEGLKQCVNSEINKSTGESSSEKLSRLINSVNESLRNLKA